MNFQSLAKIEDGNTYLDIAFRKGRKRLLQQKLAVKIKGRVTREWKSRILERDRVETIRAELVGQLLGIESRFPKFSEFDDFYYELSDSVLNLDAVRLALGSVKWAAEQIDRLGRETHRRIRGVELNEVNKIRSAFIGRSSSILKQINSKLKVLDDARKILRRFPHIKTSIPTIVLSGVPNVGKSSILTELTGADPEINSYPFTTKQLMLGYIKENDKKIQIIDSPGLLDRAQIHANKIEKQALLALKHLAKKIIYIFDISETCGYTLQEQINLYEEIRDRYKIPMIIIVNKIDLVTKSVCESFKNQLNRDILFMHIKETKKIKNLRKQLLDTFSV